MLLHALGTLLLLCMCMTVAMCIRAAARAILCYVGIRRILHQSCCYRYNAGSFFANWAAVLLSLLTAQSIGLLVGSVITHPKTGQTIATITALTMILVSTTHPTLPILFFSLRLCTVGTMQGPSLLTGQQCC